MDIRLKSETDGWPDRASDWNEIRVPCRLKMADLQALRLVGYERMLLVRD